MQDIFHIITINQISYIKIYEYTIRNTRLNDEHN